MNYHNLTYPDMNNGDGLRVVLWLSGCTHHCYNCQNPQTWKPDGGIIFDADAKGELINELEKNYTSGLTLTGGDPLHENNLEGVFDLVTEIRKIYPTKTLDTVRKVSSNHNILREKTEEIRVSFPEKTIWLYTGYTWEELFNKSFGKEFICTTTTDKNAIYRQQIIRNIDVLVDGRYIDDQRDITLKWRGSSNQRVIDIQKTLEKGNIVEWCD